MLAAYAWICGIFLGVPALLMSIVNPSASGEILLTVASFVVSCLLTGALLCDWAGREIARRKWPAFCMAGLSLLVAVLAVPSLALVLAPPASGVSSGVLWLGLTYVVMMMIFGAGPAALAAVLFIGGVERADTWKSEAS
ncbi:MAG: hypothetical protein H4O13_17780 [Xanthomonadales bacterium]|nr:hypothetical protein [Xanthomonadales bacterium]